MLSHYINYRQTSNTSVILVRLDAHQWGSWLSQDSLKSCLAATLIKSFKSGLWRAADVTIRDEPLWTLKGGVPLLHPTSWDENLESYSCTPVVMRLSKFEEKVLRRHSLLRSKQHNSSRSLIAFYRWPVFPTKGKVLWKQQVPLAWILPRRIPELIENRAKKGRVS